MDSIRILSNHTSSMSHTSARNRDAKRIHKMTFRNPKFEEKTGKKMVDHWLKHVVRRDKDPINRPDS